MRWHLLQTFDEIYVLDLHGNAHKQENDQNVFDIQQGVSINFFIKTGKKKPGKLTDVFYYSLHGSRKSKFQFLEKNNWKNIPYKKLTMHPPYYFFYPKNFQHTKTYQQGFKLSELFVVKSVGVSTSRDHLNIHFTKKSLQSRLCDFVKLGVEDARKKYKLHEDKQEWKVHLAQNDLKGIEEIQYPSTSHSLSSI